MREIGSNFYLSKPELQRLLSESPVSDERKNKEEGVLYLSTGRKAILSCLRDMERKQPIVRALLPEYTCYSVIQPFREHGLECFYYPVNKDLHVKTSTLNELIADLNIDVLLVHPYFGFDSILQDEPLKNDVIVIHDATQSYFSKIAYSFSDYSITSLRKWFALPDGAIALKNEGEFQIDALEEDRSLVDMMIQAFTKKADYILEGHGEKKSFMADFEKALSLIRKQENIHRMARESMLLYRALDTEALVNNRRSNFQYLLDHGNWHSLGELPFNGLGENTVPLYFPLLVTQTDRRKLQQYLAKQDVYCPVIWTRSDYLKDRSLSPDVKDIYQTTLSIPIDQRYNDEDMKRITVLINDFGRSAK